MPTTLFVSLGRYLKLIRRELQPERPMWVLDAGEANHERQARTRRHNRLANHRLPRVRNALPTSRTSRQMEVV